MVMQPNDPNYTGSEPVVMSSMISLGANGNQIIQGVVSHPKGVVKAAINGTVVAQTTASLKGEFTLEIPSGQMPPNPSDISITEEKVSLIAWSVTPRSLFSLISRLWGTAYAQTETRVSKPLLITPIPATLTGFTYAQNYQVVPHARVNVLAFGSLPYATGYADDKGFISIPTRNLPPFGYTVEVRDPATSNVLNKQTPKQFIATNKTYATSENINYYQPILSALPVPKASVISQVKAEAKAKSNSSMQTPHIAPEKTQQLSANFAPTTIPASAPTTNASFNALFPFLLIMGLLVGFVVVILFISRARNSTRPLV